MAMGYRCFTQELRIQIPTLKRVPESAIELFLECVFVRPSWRKHKVRIDIWVASPNQGGRTDACVRPGTCSWWEWIGGVV
jgi:hypothetical protein